MHLLQQIDIEIIELREVWSLHPMLQLNNARSGNYVLYVGSLPDRIRNNSIPEDYQ